MRDAPQLLAQDLQDLNLSVSTFYVIREGPHLQWQEIGIVALVIGNGIYIYTCQIMIHILSNDFHVIISY